MRRRARRADSPRLPLCAIGAKLRLRQTRGSPRLRTRSLLQPRVGAVLALVDPAHGGHVQSVHDFRVAARSLRAALRILTRRPESVLVLNTREALGQSIRSLADVRDRDVGHALLARLPAETQSQTALKRRASSLCESDRQRGLAHCLAIWPRRLDRLLVGLLERKEPPLKVIIRRARAEAWQQRRRAIDMITALGRRYDPERLHQLRIRIRRVRYALEVLAEVDLSAHPRLVLLKPLQSGLGVGQDRIVLSDWLNQKAAEFRWTDASVASYLRREAAGYRAQAALSHRAFLKLRPREALESLALHVDPLRGAARSGVAPQKGRAPSTGRIRSKEPRPPARSAKRKRR